MVSNKSRKNKVIAVIDGKDQKEAEMLNIQSKVLNARPSPRKREELKSNEVDEDEIERHSIAVDMRTMQEMHESLTHE